MGAALQNFERRLPLISWALCLATVIGLIVFGSFDRKLTVEEHGFIAGHARAIFDMGWAGAARWYADLLKNDTAWESHTGESAGFNDCSSTSCSTTALHPTISRLRALLEDDFIVGVVDDWLGDRAGSGLSVPSGQNLTQRLPQFQPASATNRNVVQKRFGGFPTAAAARRLAISCPSARGDSRDLFVLVFSFDLENRKEFIVAGLGIALSQLLRSVPWMSRNVLVLFADNSGNFAQETRGFLEEFTKGTNGTFNKGGIIRMAAVVEMASDSPKAEGGQKDLLMAANEGGRRKWERGFMEEAIGMDAAVDVEGLDGLLPNQDLPNVFLTEAKTFGLRAAPARMIWRSIIRFIKNEGIHRPHSPFLSQRIPAFTILVPRKTFQFDDLTVRLGKSLEGLLRSSSNVLQSLHHSFNLYFYASPETHVSSGVFFFVLVPMIAVPVLWGLFELRRVPFPALFVPFGLIAALIGLQLPAYSLAMKNAASSCSALDGNSQPLQSLIVALWLVRTAVGYAVAVGVILMVDFLQSLRRSGREGFCLIYSSLVRLVGGSFLLLLMVLNWSLCLPAVLWIVPGLLLQQPIHPRIFCQPFLNLGALGIRALGLRRNAQIQRDVPSHSSEGRPPSGPSATKLPPPRAVTASSNSVGSVPNGRPVVQLLSCSCYVLWMVCSVVVLWPLDGRCEIGRRFLLELLEGMARKAALLVSFTVPAVEALGIDGTGPTRLAVFLSSVTLSAPSAGSSLMSDWSVPGAGAMDVLKNGWIDLNGGRLMDLLDGGFGFGWLEEYFGSIGGWIAPRLQPSFVETVRQLILNERCGGSQQFALMSLGILPLVVLSVSVALLAVPGRRLAVVKVSSGSRTA